MFIVYQPIFMILLSFRLQDKYVIYGAKLDLA